MLKHDASYNHLSESTAHQYSFYGEASAVVFHSTTSPEAHTRTQDSCHHPSHVGFRCRLKQPHSALPFVSHAVVNRKH
jgi:hypothetical protein